eukprot:gene29882-39661_t
MSGSKKQKVGDQTSKQKNMYVCPVCQPEVFGKLKKMKDHVKSMHPHLPLKESTFKVIKVPKGTVPSREPLPAQPLLKLPSAPATVFPKKPAIKEVEIKTVKRTYGHGTYQDQFLEGYHINDYGGDYNDDEIEENGDSDDEDDNDEGDCGEEDSSSSERLLDIFFQRDKAFSNQRTPNAKSATLLGDSMKDHVGSWGLLGRLTHATYKGAVGPEEGKNSMTTQQQVYLNTDVPFAAVAVGVQGAGKSHTLSSIIECCMLPNVYWPRDIIQLESPMTTLMFHYDQNPTNVCEATGLIEPSDLVRMHWNRSQKQGGPIQEDGVDNSKSSLPLFRLPALDKENLVVLCSPSYYHQRKRYYGDYCQVRPLLFPWESLTAKQIKTLMRIDESGTQLYVAVMLDLLRRYQRDNLIPNFADFIRKIESTCSGAQISPLKQRQALLESIILESELNAKYRDFGADLHSCMRSGMLVIADLTDPLLSPDEANGIFEVLLEQFRALGLPGGKLVALDEAHKFMSAASRSEGLSSAIVDTVRLMRHEGIR